MVALEREIWECLDDDLLGGAEMLAEQLLAVDNYPESKYLYGLILFRQGRYRSAARATKGLAHAGCLYIYAYSCLHLENYANGIEVLESSRSIWRRKAVSAKTDFDRRTAGPSTAAFYLLLGKLYNREGNSKKSAICLAQSAKLNPYLWENVILLCQDVDVELKTSNVFTKPPPSASDTAESDALRGMPPPSSASTLQQTPRGAPGTGAAPQYSFYNSLSTPNSTSLPISNLAPAASSTPAQNTVGGRSTKNSFLLSPVNASVDNRTPSRQSGHVVFTPLGSLNSPSTQNQAPMAPVRRRGPVDPPTPIASTPRPTSSLNELSSLASNLGGLGSSFYGRSFKQNNPITNLSASAFGTAPVPLMDFAHCTEHEVQFSHYSRILELLASAYQYAARYECRQALQRLQLLPLAHRETPAVLALTARCHFDAADYGKSFESFRHLREVDPYRIKDMDMYSTVLWHLRKGIELGFLAHELNVFARDQWQTWCVLGNAFSLEQDPTKAIECFKRAVQLNKKSAVALTLQGHEHLCNEEYQNALDAFRLALRADMRYYTAWYGLGMVFLRLRDLDQAEVHFQQALHLHPRNAVLICFLGGVLEQRGLLNQALAYYKDACEIQPSSEVARFKKAEALIDAKMYSTAIQELRDLEMIVPSEASVQYALGRAYKGLNNYAKALKHLTIAIDIDPKSHDIRAELEEVAGLAATKSSESSASNETTRSVR